MSIAEKLQIIAENEQKVYNAGYEKGKSEGGGSGEQPTLFTPSIALQSVTSVLTITDNRNGDFVQGYNVYANDNLITVLTSKEVTLNDYIEHTKTLEIKVQAVGANFNPSDYAVVEWKYVNVAGTAGLAYSLSSDGTYATCTGIGEAVVTDIEIASMYEGVPVIRISSDAFNSNNNITSLVIPETVTIIDDYVGYKCTNLTSIIIPDGVTSIGESVCGYTNNLKSITIPASVRSIGNYVCYSDRSNTNLDKIVMLPSTPPTIAVRTFSSPYGVHAKQIIVPKGCLDAYKSATNWSNFASKMVEATE